MAVKLSSLAQGYIAGKSLNPAEAMMVKWRDHTQHYLPETYRLEITPDMASQKDYFGDQLPLPTQQTLIDEFLLVGTHWWVQISPHTVEKHMESKSLHVLCWIDAVDCVRQASTHGKASDAMHLGRMLLDLDGAFRVDNALRTFEFVRPLGTPGAYRMAAHLRLDPLALTFGPYGSPLAAKKPGTSSA